VSVRVCMCVRVCACVRVCVRFQWCIYTPKIISCQWRVLSGEMLAKYYYILALNRANQFPICRPNLHLLIKGACGNPAHVNM